MTITATTIIADLVVSQARSVASLHKGNEAIAQAKNDTFMKEAIFKVNTLESLRKHHARYIPALRRLDGWWHVLDGQPHE